MIVIYKASVRADRDIDACFLIVGVTLFSDFNKGRSLSSSYSLGFTGDTDGASADSHLYKVCTAGSKEPEACFIDYVSSSYLYLIPVFFPDPGKGPFLPLRKTLGRVDAEYIHPCFYKGWNPFLVVTGVDSCSYQVSFMGIQYFKRIFLVGIVVLSEDKIHQLSLIIYNWQGV